MDRPTITTACVVCGRVFEARRTTAMYCSETCRKRRQRMNGLEPIMPAPLVVKTNATEEDVAAAIVTARTASNAFAQLGKAAPPPLRAGCERISLKIEGAIREEGW